MTPQQFIEEIKRLSVADRIALAEAIFRSLREELETQSAEDGTTDEGVQGMSAGDEQELRIAAVRRLRGVLKTAGESPSDQEMKEDYTNHLVEKYS
ncbi:MAG TPA: hypothetical protein VF507_02050 [Pyrinomonadaceae bacterium]|jgi:hypothetical protein